MLIGCCDRGTLYCEADRGGNVGDFTKSLKKLLRRSAIDAFTSLSALGVDGLSEPIVPSEHDDGGKLISGSRLTTSICDDTGELGRKSCFGLSATAVGTFLPTVETVVDCDEQFSGDVNVTSDLNELLLALDCRGDICVFADPLMESAASAEQSPVAIVKPAGERLAARLFGNNTPPY